MRLIGIKLHHLELLEKIKEEKTLMHYFSKVNKGKRAKTDEDVSK